MKHGLIGIIAINHRLLEQKLYHVKFLNPEISKFYIHQWNTTLEELEFNLTIKAPEIEYD